jgi:hypothetical protein
MERPRSASHDRDTPPAQEGERAMHAIPPEGPLRPDDRDEPAWLDERPSERHASDDRNRRRAAIPTLLLVAAVALIVALIVLL